MMKPILVDFDTERLEKLEEMKSITALPRNELIRLAVDFFYEHPLIWQNDFDCNSYQKHNCQESNEPPAACLPSQHDASDAGRQGVA